MHELKNNIEQEYIISSKTLNKMIKILEDKPFKLVVDLLNEIKAVPYNSEQLEVSNEKLQNHTIDNI